MAYLFTCVIGYLDHCLPGSLFRWPIYNLNYWFPCSIFTWFIVYLTRVALFLISVIVYLDHCLLWLFLFESLFTLIIVYLDHCLP